MLGLVGRKVGLFKVDTKSYQGLHRHFCPVNDQSDHFLIESDHKSKELAGRPRK